MKTSIKYIAVGTAGLAIGFGAGYFVARKRIGTQATAAIERMEAAYSDWSDRLGKTGAYATPEGAAAVFIQNTDEQLDIPDEKEDFVDEYADSKLNLEDLNEQHDEKEQVDVEDFVKRFRERQNDNYGGVTFPGQVDGDGDDIEPDDTPIPTVPEWTTVRDPHGPYVISIDEYMEDDSPFTKIEMTYFEGDETLIDSREQIVPDIDGTVGIKNLLRFGEGTPDKYQVYVRNERLEIDVEITRDDNTYSRVVLGIVPADEIARSMTKPLKMRADDE